MRKFSLFIFTLILCLFWSCVQGLFKIDVSESDSNVEIVRFEQVLFNQPLTKVQQSALAQYPDFFIPYTAQVLRLGDARSEELPELLSDFTSDEYIKQVSEEVAITFEDFEKEIQIFQKTFAYYNYYFPKRKTPKLLTYISGFNYATIATDSTLAIGLDMFLGPTHEFYQYAQFPLYKRMLLHKKFMASQAMENWIRSEFAEPQNENMLSKLLYEGKVMLALEATMPEAPDSIRFKYSLSQMEWAQLNEFNVWSYFVDEQLLYSSLYTDYYKFFKEAPFTASLARESPPKMGQFMGWKIVRSYWENNQPMTMEELFALPNDQKFLKLSKYKPSK